MRYEPGIQGQGNNKGQGLKGGGEVAEMGECKGENKMSEFNKTEDR